MSRRIDRRVRDAAPIRDEDVRRLPLDSEGELLNAIVEQPRDAADGFDAAPARRRSTRTRRIGMTLAATAAVGVFALVGVQLTSDGDLQTGPDHVWASSVLKVADAVPRLTIDQDGWTVTRADEFQVDDGEMEFAKDDVTATLTWRAAATHADYVADRTHGTERLPSVDVTGARADAFKYEGTGDHDDFTALWRSGRYSLELRMSGEQVTQEQFVATLRALRPVGVDQWLSAMPASVVKPADRANEVEQMLAGLPLPDGFDAGTLMESDGISDRYQLGAKVSGAVACAWFDQWATARGDGDRAAERAAADALATSRRWPILNEMNAAGDYPEVLWEYADAANADGRVTGGKSMPVEVAVVEGLGCEQPEDASVPQDERADVLAGAAGGIPVPDGVDLVALVEPRADLNDRYELQRGVVDAAACSWLDRWVAARRAGDRAAARAAADALATAREWPVVSRLPQGGDFPTTLVEFADATSGDGRVWDGTRRIEDAYSPAFGCSGF